MLDDLAKTVKAQLYERVSSPLLGAFALSWIAWNYRFLLVLLSSMPVTEKFTYIDTNLFGSYQVIFLHGTLYPLLTTLSLIFIYPIPAKFVYEYWRKRQRELKEIQQRIDDETPLTREEARELRHETLKARLEFEQELERRTNEITRLKETIKELPERNVSSLTKRGKSANKPDKEIIKLNEQQTQMLKRVAESTSSIPRRKLISSSGKDKVLSEYNLGELESKDLVRSEYDMDTGDHAVNITHAGRSHLINHVWNNEARPESPELTQNKPQ